jgi:hypothetical protein
VVPLMASSVFDTFACSTLGFESHVFACYGVVWLQFLYSLLLITTQDRNEYKECFQLLDVSCLSPFSFSLSLMP